MMHPRGMILVIDDDEPIRTLVADLLTEEGYDPQRLPSATLAWEAVHRDPPDLIVLDVWMERPDSGWQFLAALHADPTTRQIPVVVASAHVWMMAEMQARFPESHYAFVKKPFSLDALLDAIVRLLPERPPHERSVEHS